MLEIKIKIKNEFDHFVLFMYLIRYPTIIKKN